MHIYIYTHIEREGKDNRQNKRCIHVHKMLKERATEILEQK